VCECPRVLGKRAREASWDRVISTLGLRTYDPIPVYLPGLAGWPSGWLVAEAERPTSAAYNWLHLLWHGNRSPGDFFFLLRVPAGHRERDARNVLSARYFFLLPHNWH
jgi:hypothetical protein